MTLTGRPRALVLLPLVGREVPSAAVALAAPPLALKPRAVGKHARALAAALAIQPLAAVPEYGKVRVRAVSVSGAREVVPERRGARLSPLAMRSSPAPHFRPWTNLPLYSLLRPRRSPRPFATSEVLEYDRCWVWC